jgi:hypothetical protein
MIATNERGILMIDAGNIDETVPVSHPDARRLLGIAHCSDPDQLARRMVRQGVPHLRIGRRIRFSIPALKAWAAERINNSVTASAETA